MSWLNSFVLLLQEDTQWPRARYQGAPTRVSRETWTSSTSWEYRSALRLYITMWRAQTHSWIGLQMSVIWRIRQRSTRFHGDLMKMYVIVTVCLGMYGLFIYIVCALQQYPAAMLEVFNNEAIVLANRGVTILVSSGDNGVHSHQCSCTTDSSSSTLRYSTPYSWTGTGYFPSFPATSPYGMCASVFGGCVSDVLMC